VFVDPVEKIVFHTEREVILKRRNMRQKRPNVFFERRISSLLGHPKPSDLKNMSIENMYQNSPDLSSFVKDGSAAAQEELEQKKLAQLKNMHIPGGGHGQVWGGGAGDRKPHPMLAPLPDVIPRVVGWPGGGGAGGGGQGQTQGQTPRLPPIEVGWVRP
jgi:hypothetical protein